LYGTLQLKLINKNIANMFRSLFFLVLSMFMVSCQTLKLRTLEAHELKPDQAKNYAIYAMMASNAYEDIASLRRFPLESLGWNSDPEKHYSDYSGLSFDVFEKENSNEVVFAFRGTNDFLDYLTHNFAIVSLQAILVDYELSKYKKKVGNKNIVLTGHSLGGGLAIGMSLKHCLKAVTFDASPRIFDGFGIKLFGYDGDCDGKNIDRVLIYTKGEILELTRRFSIDQFKEKIVQKDNTFKVSTDANDGKCQNFVCKHEMEPLAIEILRRGKLAENKELDIICDAINCEEK